MTFCVTLDYCEIETLEEMVNMRKLRHVDRSCLNESEYSLLAKFYDEVSLDKPPQVGTTWPTLMEGKLTLVVHWGGQCFGCEREMSGKIAKYVYRGETCSLRGYEAAVFPWVKENISCDNKTCLDKIIENRKGKRPKWGDEENDELKKLIECSVYCDQCLKAGVNIFYYGTEGG